MPQYQINPSNLSDLIKIFICPSQKVWSYLGGPLPDSDSGIQAATSWLCHLGQWSPLLLKQEKGEWGEAYMSSPTSAQKSLPLVHGSELSHGSYLSPREPGNKSPVSQEKETMFHHLLSPPGPTIPFPLCLLHTLSFT